MLVALYCVVSFQSYLCANFLISAVAYDESLNAFLESYLKFRSRWCDFPHRGAREIVAGVVVGEFELSRRVFMVLYRL